VLKYAVAQVGKDVGNVLFMPFLVVVEIHATVNQQAGRQASKAQHKPSPSTEHNIISVCLLFSFFMK
jgi:hypothetical protein